MQLKLFVLPKDDKVRWDPNSNLHVEQTAGPAVVLALRLPVQMPVQLPPSTPARVEYDPCICVLVGTSRAHMWLLCLSTSDAPGVLACVGWSLVCCRSRWGKLAPPRHIFTLPRAGNKKKLVIPVTLEFFFSRTLQVPSRLPSFIV